MGRSMTDIEDVRSAAQLFTSLQSQGATELAYAPSRTPQRAQRGLLTKLHLTQGLTYPAT